MALLVSQTYAGVFLNAADLAPQGRRRTAVVHNVAAEEIGQEKRQVLVLDLVSPAGKPWPKRVVLNKSNSMQLAAAFGDDAARWPGQSIEIWAENVMFQGRLVPGVKVLPATTGAGQAAASGRVQQPAGNGNGAAAPPAAAAIPDDVQLASGVDTGLDDEIPF